MSFAIFSPIWFSLSNHCAFEVWCVWLSGWFTNTSCIIVENKVRNNANKFNFIPVDASHKKPTRKDMVYFEDSPDFCMLDSKYQFEGIFLSLGQSPLWFSSHPSEEVIPYHLLPSETILDWIRGFMYLFTFDLYSYWWIVNAGYPSMSQCSSGLITNARPKATAQPCKEMTRLIQT